MSQTSREIVVHSLKFEGPERMPRDIWAKWKSIPPYHHAEIAEIKRRFPSDMGSPGKVYQPSSRKRGVEWYAVGIYVDEWGCIFTNIQEGVMGEVRDPILPDIQYWKSINPPYDILPENWVMARDLVNRDCANSSKFMMTPIWVQPWERYQFIRGTQNALIDLMDQNAAVQGLLRRIHEFYLKELEFWVTTNVDALLLMDDWGSQRQLLIPPGIWRELFKPLYQDYCDLAHSHGKFIFMHSDGNITEIYPDIVRIGIDALNSQLFCMDLAELAHIAKGKITFWGEIDRQQVLPSLDPAVGRNAVRKVAQHLYDPAGGIIAHFELGKDANPSTAIAIFEEWEQVDREVRQR